MTKALGRLVGSILATIAFVSCTAHDASSSWDFSCGPYPANFQAKFFDALNCLRQGPSELHGMVEHLAASAKSHRICVGRGPFDPAYPDSNADTEPQHHNDGVGVQQTITTWTPPPDTGCMDPANGSDPACLYMSHPPLYADDGVFNNPIATLAHELWHAYEKDQGALDERDDPCSGYGNSSEVRSVDAENSARLLPCAQEDRDGNGEPDIRTRYSGSELCVCGNNRIEPENVETCDGTDDAECSGRGCYPPGHDRRCTCKPPPTCGDGEIDPSSEECDPGDIANGIPANAPSCPLHCTPLTSRVPCKCRPKSIVYDTTRSCDGGLGNIANNCIEVWGPSLDYSSDCPGESAYLTQARETLSIPPCSSGNPYCCELWAAKAAITIDPNSFYLGPSFLELAVRTAQQGSCADRIGQCCIDTTNPPATCGGVNGFTTSFSYGSCNCPILHPDDWPFHACPACP